MHCTIVSITHRAYTVLLRALFDIDHSFFESHVLEKDKYINTGRKPTNFPLPVCIHWSSKAFSISHKGSNPTGNSASTRSQISRNHTSTIQGGVKVKEKLLTLANQQGYQSTL